MSNQDMELPREDDRNDELDESPLPDPERTRTETNRGVQDGPAGEARGSSMRRLRVGA